MSRITTRLTESKIKQVIAQLDCSELKDERSPLLFRFNKSRQRGTFYWLNHQHGKTIWIKLCSFPEHGVAHAKKLIKQGQQNLLRQQLNGRPITPSTEQLSTVAELLEWYLNRLEHDRNLSCSTKTRVTRQIKKHLLPNLGTMAIVKLNQQVLSQSLFEPLLPVLHHATLRNNYQTLQQSLMAASGSGLIDSNPLTNLKFQDLCSQKIKPKIARLNPSQLRDVRIRIEEARAPLNLILRLLLSYGTRLTETLLIRWQDIDWQAQKIYLPAQHTKTRQPHQLPLTETSEQWLRTYQRHQRDHSPYLFPHHKHTELPCSASSVANKIHRLTKGQWSAHDLRKLARTCWLELGIDHVIGEFLLNHNLPQVQRAYIQTQADKGCFEAVKKWQEYLLKQAF